MRFERSVQIDVGDNLAVDNDKSSVLQEWPRIIQGAAGSQDLWLFHVMQGNAKLTTVSQRPPNRLRSMMKVNYNLIAFIVGQVFSNIPDEWFAQYGYCRFSSVLRQWPETS